MRPTNERRSANKLAGWPAIRIVACMAASRWPTDGQCADWPAGVLLTRADGHLDRLTCLPAWPVGLVGGVAGSPRASPVDGPAERPPGGLKRICILARSAPVPTTGASPAAAHSSGAAKEGADRSRVVHGRADGNVSIYSIIITSSTKPIKSHSFIASTPFLRRSARAPEEETK